MDPIIDQSIERGFEPQPAPEPSIPRRALAPVWHTVLLVLFILFVSLRGVYRHPGANGAGVTNRLTTYGVTAVMELALAGWVVLGLRLRKIPIRSLFGTALNDFHSIAFDLGIAAVFWIGSLMALASVALVWVSIETAVTHRHAPIHAGQPFAPDASQQTATKAVLALAPTNGREIAAWVALCLLVGVAEELVFRGYLQQQFTAWARGAAGAGVVFSAITFGAAHGYEGVRSMFLLSVFGAFFSLLALYRRSLRAGIFAHSWHDIAAGLTIALLHSRHIV
jgi:uncharacterized protein